MKLRATKLRTTISNRREVIRAICPATLEALAIACIGAHTSGTMLAGTWQSAPIMTSAVQTLVAAIRSADGGTNNDRIACNSSSPDGFEHKTFAQSAIIDADGAPFTV